MFSQDDGKKGKKTVEQIYQKKTQLEHILLRPDTYGTDIPVSSPLTLKQSEVLRN